MRITQPTEFKPITIILGTKEEAESFWAAIRFSLDKLEFKYNEKEILIAISNWFSNSAQF